jgi:hypothetical protein
MRIEEIENNEWFRKDNVLMNSSGLCGDKNMLLEYMGQKTRETVSFSQPEAFIRKMGGFNDFISSQPNTATFDFPSMKRIYIHDSPDRVVNELIRILESLVVPYTSEGGNISFSTVDGRRCTLSGEATITTINNTACVSFYRLKGDCIEFKKFFNVICDKMKEVFSQL